MRLVILSLAGALLLVAACSDDSSSGTPPDSKPWPSDCFCTDLGTPDGPVTKPDQKQPQMDQKPPQPDINVSVPDAGALKCAAWDAKGVGMCSMFLGYIWDGKACKGISGCSCGGADCFRIYSSPAKCTAGQASCP